MKKKCLQAFWSIAVILSVSSIAHAQDLVVNGTVTSSVDGQPLPGVSVVMKNTNKGVSTDMQGRYSLPEVPQDGILVFSFLGFKTQEVSVSGRTEINIVLEEDLAKLDEVVVVGYGTQKKRDVTGSITSIGSDAIEERQPVTLVDAIQSQASGVLVMNDSGEPGASGSIRIRGYSTFSGAGNSPLYVIDGVLSDDANSINPNDIESIEILRDGASAAIYGSRAANGVIIITTKRGVAGKPKIEARYSHVFGDMAHKLRQANADEVRLYRRLQRPTNDAAGTSADSLNPGFNADVDHQDLITQVANRDQIDFSVSGGSEKLSYYTSLRYLNDQGLIVNSWAKTIQARINIDYQASKRFKYGNRIQLGYRNKNNISERNTINQTFQRPTNFRLYYPDGSLTGYVGGRRNPLAVALHEKNETETYSGNIFNFIEYRISPDLKFNTNLNFDLEMPHTVYFSPKILSSNNPLLNSGREAIDFDFYWAYQAYFNYEKVIADDHTITGMAGFSAERTKYNSFDIAGDNYVNESIFTLNAATIDPADTRTGAGAHSLASFFGRVGYSYKGKYIFNGTYRRDGSSRFGKANPWANFFSAAAAWRFSDEPFMDWASSFLDDAKFRVSYGQNGNERIGDYDAIQRYTFGDNFYNGVSGVVLSSSFGNKDLSWESTTQKNIGIDLVMLKGRLNFTTDYYIKTTEDLLYQRPLPAETGFNSSRINIGTIENKGLEFAVNATPVVAGDWQWKVIGNISFERGTVKELYNSESFLSGSLSATRARATWLVKEGGKLGDFYIWKSQGVFPYDESNAFTDDWSQLTPNFDEDGNFTGYTFNGQPYTGEIHSLYGNGVKLRGGDINFYNPTKDSLINDDDRIIAGNAQPDFYAGLINTVSYKNLSLSFTFNTSWGAKVFNRARADLNDYQTTHVIPEPYVIYNAWQKPGDITDVPEVTRRRSTGNARPNTRYLEDASFIRLSNARLTYRLQPELASKLKIKGMSIYAYGINLLTWTDYSWFDPEFSSSNALQMGEDRGRYPRRREFGLGLQINL